MRTSIVRSKILTLGVLAAFLLLVFPAGELAAAQPSAGSLIGFVYAKDMKTPVANAVVKLKSVNDMKEYSSSPADQNGMYKVAGLPNGRYVVGVTATEGNFNFSYVLNIKSDEMAKLSVALVPGAQPQSGQGQGSKKKSFFTSPAGIMVLVTVAGAVLYTILKDEDEASPVVY